MRRMLRSLAACLGLFCALMPLSGLSVRGMESGTHSATMVYENSKTAHYRIPNAVATKDGKVLLFANDRGTTSSDASQEQGLCVSISTDGVHFSDPKTILYQKGWTYVLGSLVYDAETGKILVVYSGLPRSAEAIEAFGKLPKDSREPTGMSIVESDDGFETWTQRKIVFPAVTEAPYVAPGTHGCNTGIQLTRGEYAGRLILPGLLSTSNGSGMKNQLENKHACLLYSDDHGLTWQVSNVTPDGCSEMAVAELSDGTVYVNCRSLLGTSRYVGVSRDGGKTLTEMHLDPTLVEPGGGGCKGSLLTVPDGNGGQLLLYANVSWPTSRKNFCVWMSADDGSTWGRIAVLEPGTAGYSSMAYNPVSGLITVMYEVSGSGIRQETFDLAWLMANSTDYVPFRENQTPQTAVPGIVRDGLVAELTPDGLTEGTDAGWKDASGHGNDAVRGVGANLPAVKPSACGSLPAMSFGGSEALEISGSTLPDGDLTVFLVFRAGMVPEDNRSVLITTGSLNFFSFYLSGTQQTFASVVQSGRTQAKVLTNTFLDTEWHILALTWNGEDPESACFTQFFDGSRDDFKYCIREDAVISAKDANLFTLGTQFQGEIAEVLIWNRALDDAEVASVGLSLADIFGLSWSGVERQEPDAELPTAEQPETGTDSGTSAPAKGGCSSSVSAVLPMALLSAVGIRLTEKRRKNK